MKLPKKTEERLKLEVTKHLERGRPGWDVPHTLACVYWMKELLKYEMGNAKILVSAIYFHDISYPDKKFLLKPRKNLELKKEHMRKGAILAKKILNKIEDFSKEEIEQISYLVSIHDDLDFIKESGTKDIQMVFEADSLGQIDRERVKPTFSKTDSIKFLNRFEKGRAKMFKTKTGKKFLKKLFKEALKYTSKTD